ncbi:hypothetical protein ACVUTH_17115, partial [Escherichia coli]
DVFAGKKSAQIREILISESTWEEMTCLFAPSLAVYIISIITMIAEDFACSGNGSMIFLICYFSTFSMLMLAPTDSSKQ